MQEPIDNCKCVICQRDTQEPLTRLTERGLKCLITSCVARKMHALERHLTGSGDIPHVTHNSCRKRFTDLRAVKSVSDTDLLTSSKRLRSSTVFEWKRMCFFCEMAADSDSSNVRTASTIELRQSVLNRCALRGDNWALDVQGRIEDCCDLVHPEAVYHSYCHTRFFQGRDICRTGSAGRPLDVVMVDAFDKLCEWVESCCEDRLYTLDELRGYMVNYVADKYEKDTSETVNVYSTKHLKDKLKLKYGDNVYFAEVSGRKNVLCFRNFCSVIINDKWYSDRVQDSEKDSERIVKTAAKLIVSEIRNLHCDLNCYPTVADMQSGGDIALPLLQVFLKNLIPSQLKQLAVSQCILQAARPRTVIAPLLLGLGVQLDHAYGSKFLLQQLSRLGMSVSYDEVERYRQSVFASKCQGSDTVQSTASGMTQWVADNVDHNVRTLDGHGSFHGMGIISATVDLDGEFGPSDYKVQRLQQRLLGPQVRSGQSIPIHRYTLASKTGLSAVTMKDVRQLQRPICLPQIMQLNIVWHLSLNREITANQRPNWGGFMQSSSTGRHTPAAAITMLPLIDIKPTDETCLYSTLLFVDSQAKKLHIPSASVTFDQPLYLKAVEISKAADLNNVVCRLGGFHLLMSFLGAIGTVMSGSGLQELMGLVYGADTVQHMLAGKAVSRALRAHLLIQSALMTILLKQVIPFRNDESVEVICDDDYAVTADDLAEVVNVCATVSEGAQDYETSDILQCSAIAKIEAELQSLNIRLSTISRTAKLWIRYMYYVDVCKAFILAERTGNWHLHLQTVHDMLNLLAATGHTHYGKCARLYLQLMNLLPDEHPWLYDAFVHHGFHSVRRSDRYWAGLSPDLLIEQTLMKTIKGRSGLTRGRGLTESVRSLWIGTLHRSAAVHLAMSELTGLHTVTQQHVDVGMSRVKRDSSDLQKFVDWLNAGNPFAADDSRLRSLSSGIVASESDKVTCDRAEEIGSMIHQRWNDVKFYEITLKKCEKVTTLATLLPAMSSQKAQQEKKTSNLFHRLLILAERSVDIPSFFGYELTPSPMALFRDGLMRKPDKASLARTLLSGLPTEELPSAVRYVIDGGSLLHRFKWSKTASFGQLVQQYSLHVAQNYGNTAVVVFDGYNDDPSTKDHEHRRRSARSSVKAPDIAVTADTPQLFTQQAFLSNEVNKDKFIKLLVAQLENDDVEAFQCSGDADVDIVATALKVASQPGHPVAVVADDTDILVLLTYHATKQMCDMFFVSEAKRRQHGELKPVNVQMLQEHVGHSVCNSILLIHAFSGCDTTSAIYGRSKGHTVRIFRKLASISDILHVMESEQSCTDDVAQAGIELMIAVYGGTAKDSLSSMRYRSYCSKVCASVTSLLPEKLPPTERSAIFHALRVHQQVVVWKKLDVTCMDPCKWGWKLLDGRLEPIMTDQQHAPDSVLHLIRCQCTKGCLTLACTCRRNNHSCMAACVNCQGRSCSNREVKTLSKLSDEVEEHHESHDEHNLPDVLLDDDLDWLDEETVDEVNSAVVKSTRLRSPCCCRVMLIRRLH